VCIWFRRFAEKNFERGDKVLGEEKVVDLWVLFGRLLILILLKKISTNRYLIFIYYNLILL